MEGMIMTAQLLLSLSILIVVHEWGHFITARTFGIKVEKFYLFFDFLFPMANVLNFSLLKFKKGDTEYGIGWFPLGGYVKIAGMVDESMDKEALKAPAEDWEFRSKKPWQRLIVMLGGIIVNVIVGCLIFIGLTFFLGDTYIPKDYVNNHGGIQALTLGEQIGFKTGDKVIKINGSDFEDFQDIFKPDVLLTHESYYIVLRDGKEVRIDIPGDFIQNFNKEKAIMTFIAPRYPSVIGEVMPELEVEELELKAGVDSKIDTIKHLVKSETMAKRIGLKVGDRFIEVQGQPVVYQDEVQQLVRKGGDSVAFKIKRGEEVLAFHEPFNNHKGIGFYPQNLDKKELVYINYSLGQSIPIGAGRAFSVVFVQLKAFKKIFTGELPLGKSLSGPVGMARAFGSEWNWQRFWYMTGLLSMVLAFTNLLPIPGLDGGYVMFLLYEMISGREPSEKFFETSLKIGMGLLLVLMVYVFYNDISKAVLGVF